jgi:hypothetical protein
LSIDKKKERDVNVRQKLIREIDKSREYLKKIFDAAQTQNNKNVSGAVKRIMDDLDIFANEAELSEVGHSYPMFSPQKSAGRRTLKKLIKHDTGIVERMRDATKGSNQLLKVLLDGEEINTENELEKLHKMVTDLRCNFQDRVNDLKGVK